MEEARIVWVTLLTSITWIGVTLLTKNQSDTIKAKMISLIHPALFIKRLTLSLMLGVLFTTLIFIGWWFILN
jgi:hypothetical protein